MFAGGSGCPSAISATITPVGDTVKPYLSNRSENHRTSGAESQICRTVNDPTQDPMNRPRET